jgi:predicted permease
MSSLFQDLRYAVRGLVRTPGFSVTAVLTLALGIGATTAVFSVFYGVTRRPLPYPNGERVVRVIQVVERPGERTAPRRAGISPEQLRDWQTTALSGVAIVSVDSATLTGGGGPVRLNGARVSPAMFSIFGVRPLMGRAFIEEEGRRGTPPTVILGYRTWVQRFGSDDRILDRAITLNDRPHQVIGVMPEDFDYPEQGPAKTRGNSTGRLEGGPEYWVPFQVAPAAPKRGGGFSLFPTIALVREDVTLERATAEANSTIPDLPNGRPPYRVELMNLREEAAREIKPVLVAFQLGVLFVLLIACVNVTNLLLARAARRRQELAIRVALGARGFQIAREMMTESTLIGIAAGTLGWFIADTAIKAILSLPAGTIPRMHEVRLDYVVFTFTFGLSVFTGLIVGLVVAIRTLRASPWLWLRQRASGFSGRASTFGRGRPSSALIVASITAAVVLLTGAGLLLNSFVRLVSVDTGFDPKGLQTFEISLPAASYSDPARQTQFMQQLDASLRSLPGVEATAVASGIPFRILGIGFSVNIPGQPESNGEAGYRMVGPGYFRTLRVPILRGREFNEQDRDGQPRVVVVNEAFARRYFGGLDAVNRGIQFMSSDLLTIVGVVGDTKASRLDTDAITEIYYPYLQPPKSGGFLSVAGIVRMSGTSDHLMPAVRAAVQRLDPSLAVYNGASMEEIVAESYALSSLYTTTATSFGAVALALAVIGLYGLLAYTVSNRTHELGIQIALGADPRRLLLAILRDGLLLTAIGLGAGLLGALGTTRFLEGLLFGVEPHDPATLTTVALLFLVVGCLAGCIPARRAMRVDPIVALRTE